MQERPAHRTEFRPKAATHSDLQTIKCLQDRPISLSCCGPRKSKIPPNLNLFTSSAAESCTKSTNRVVVQRRMRQISSPVPFRFTLLRHIHTSHCKFLRPVAHWMRHAWHSNIRRSVRDSCVRARHKNATHSTSRLKRFLPSRPFQVRGRSIGPWGPTPDPTLSQENTSQNLSCRRQKVLCRCSCSNWNRPWYRHLCCSPRCHTQGDMRSLEYRRVAMRGGVSFRPGACAVRLRGDARSAARRAAASSGPGTEAASRKEVQAGCVMRCVQVRVGQRHLHVT